MKIDNNKESKNFLLSEYRFCIGAFIYLAVYLVFFYLAEKNVTDNYHIIHLKLDDYIPFCEYFVIPYYLWFPYIGVTFFMCVFSSRQSYRRLFIFLAIGMTLFIIVSFLYPNGQNLRPTTFVRDNMFTDLVKKMYSIDTPTNLIPSIHVYNSIACHIAVLKTDNLKRKKWLRISSSILCVAIILSTLFIKQHSTLDVMSAIVLSALVYPFVYRKSI